MRHASENKQSVRQNEMQLSHSEVLHTLAAHLGEVFSFQIFIFVAYNSGNRNKGVVVEC